MQCKSAKTDNFAFLTLGILMQRCKKYTIQFDSYRKRTIPARKWYANWNIL